MTAPQIIETPSEHRQIARVLEFTSSLAPHINWDSIATHARELGANFEVRSADNGTVTITMFWAYRPEEV